jgi:hypothetical protein
VSDVPLAELVLRNAKVVTFTASQPQAESIAFVVRAAPDLELERYWKR